MSDQIILIFLIFILGAIPLTLVLNRILKTNGQLVAMLSPPLMVLVAFTIIILVRPILYLTHDFSYEFTILDRNELFLSLLLISISNYSFTFGYLAFHPKSVQKLTSHFRVRDKSSSSLLFFATLSILIAYLHAASYGILTFDLLANRETYLTSFAGAGYFSLAYTMPGLLLVWYLWVQQSDKISLCFVAIVLGYGVINILVTNRSSLTITLYGLFLVWQLKKQVNTQVGTLKIVLLLFLLVIVGVALGVSRGIDDSSEAVDSLLLGVIFLSASFDMHEMFWHALSNFNGIYYLGVTWGEDILWTYFPRAISTLKPILYGSSMLEFEVLGRDPRLIGAATFPIGLYGEGYVNFGYTGVILTTFFVGCILGFLYSRLIKNILNGPTTFNFWPLFIFLMTSANSLGYLRSFGQYLAGLLFSCALFIVIYLILFSTKFFSIVKSKKIYDGML